MLDLARVVLLLVAFAQAIRHRFALGILFGAVLCGVFAWVGWDAYLALSRQAVGGQYGIGFVYFGPTMVPRGDRDWTPLTMQVALAMLSAVPALTDRRAAPAPGADAFMFVFLPSAVLAVIAALGGYVEWRQG
jgi:hypothetical protein